MILVGIDPGTATTGWGVIEKRGDRVTFPDCLRRLSHVAGLGRAVPLKVAV